MIINEHIELKNVEDLGKNESKFSVSKKSKDGIRCPTKSGGENRVCKSSNGVSFGVSKNFRDCKNRPKKVGNFFSQQIPSKSKRTYIPQKNKNKSFNISPEPRRHQMLKL